MTASTAAQTEHLCTLEYPLPINLVPPLLNAICTTAEEAGYTNVALDPQGRITGTPPQRRAEQVDVEAIPPAATQ